MTSAQTSVEYEHGPFGETIRSTGTMAKTNSFRFSTKWQDDVTGYCYYGFGRWYDPGTGRWLSRDPMEENGGENLYAFIENVGISDFDVFGEKASKKKVPEKIDQSKPSGKPTAKKTCERGKCPD